jgi:hypothetical protein
MVGKSFNPGGTHGILRKLVSVTSEARNCLKDYFVNEQSHLNRPTSRVVDKYFNPGSTHGILGKLVSVAIETKNILKDYFGNEQPHINLNNIVHIKYYLHYKMSCSIR